MPAPNRDVIYTYRYLRGAMVALLFMMLFSVGYEWLAQWRDTGQSCFLGSISAYYYTPARTVFVGSLCALGAVLIAYKGHSPEEDVLLNFSGFMAFVVAMVPTTPDRTCGPGGFTLSPTEISLAVGNNVSTLIVAAVIAAVVAIVLRRGAVRQGRVTPPSRATLWISVTCSVVLLVELVLFLVLRDRFIAVSHGVAAATMVAGVIAVMVRSALGVEQRHPGVVTRYKRVYLGLAIGLGVMLALIVIIGLTVSGFDRIVLAAEVVIIVLFGAYWVVQTKELWALRSDPGHEARRGGAVAQ